MALAPIRGAPPGAPNPDFPMENPRVKLAKPSTAPATDDQRSIPPVRQRNTAIEIGGGGVTFTFRIIPEQPALARASMTIHIVAAGSSRSHMLGFLRMSASNARRFLTDLQNDRSPVVATGDEDGDVQIEYESTGAGPVLMVRKPGEQNTLHRWNIERAFDVKATANDLLADLGA